VSLGATWNLLNKNYEGISRIFRVLRLKFESRGEEEKVLAFKFSF
jgi:hypothetical protein